MGVTSCLVVAQGDRSLAELEVNRRLDTSALDEPLCWERADGWQCFAPVDFYDHELLPPVRAIAEQTKGPVLGVGVEDSDHFRIGFLAGDDLRVIAVGGAQDGGADRWRGEMTRRWGVRWEAQAATGLQGWAAPFSRPPHLGLWGAIKVRQVLAERSAFDVLQLLGLVARPGLVPWWIRDIPHALYAVDVREIFDPQLEPRSGPGERDLALVFIPGGIGVWSLAQRAWVVTPSTKYRDTLDALRRELEQRGWRGQGCTVRSVAGCRSGAPVEVRPRPSRASS